MVITIEKNQKELINAIKFVELGHLKKVTPMYQNFMWLRANGKRYTLVATDGRRVHMVTWKPDIRPSNISCNNVPIIKSYIPVIFSTMGEDSFMLTSVDLGCAPLPDLSKVLKGKEGAVSLGKGLISGDAELGDIYSAHRAYCKGSLAVNPKYLRKILKREANNNWEVFVQKEDPHMLCCVSESVTYVRRGDMGKNTDSLKKISSVKTQAMIMPAMTRNCSFYANKEDSE